MLAVVELLFSASGRVAVRVLGDGRRGRRVRPLRLGRHSGRRAAELVRRVEVIGAPLVEVIVVGPVELQLGLRARVSVAGGAAAPGGAAVAVRGRPQRQTLV